MWIQSELPVEASCKSSHPLTQLGLIESELCRVRDPYNKDISNITRYIGGPILGYTEVQNVVIAIFSCRYSDLCHY